jgi:outer membrane protein assembly factor BamB
MSGVTLLLRQSDLAATAGSTNDASIGSVFAWMMGASVAYGDGTLFLAQEGGLVACIDPQTGEVRGSETLPNSPEQYGAITVLAVDGSGGLVYGGDDEGVIAITPPASCWS